MKNWECQHKVDGAGTTTSSRWFGELVRRSRYALLFWPSDTPLLCNADGLDCLDANPCQNGGFCSFDGEAISCSSCDAGYEGDFCEIGASQVSVVILFYRVIIIIVSRGTRAIRARFEPLKCQPYLCFIA